MSNGIGKNPLLDISKVYLDQVAEKKDDSYLEPDMKKRQKNNEKARKDMEKMGTSMKNPHFEEKQQGWDVVNSLADAYKGMQEVEIEEAEKRIKAKGSDKSMKIVPDAGPAYYKKSKNFVKYKEEVEDVSEADSLAAMAARREKRLVAQRKKMGKTAGGHDFGHDYGATAAVRKKRQDDDYEAAMGRKPSPKNEGLDPVGKEDGDVNNDGKKDSSDSYLMKRRKAIGSAMKKKLKESRSLAEVMTDTEDDKPIKEKKINNKIKINPKLGEAVEELGGELLEMTEVDEAVYGGTPAKKEAPKDNRMTVTNADKKGNTPAYQAYKAGNKKYKAADHMNEGDGDPCWDSHKQVGMKKKGGKMVPNCVPKNEEVETEVEEGYKELSRGKRNTMFRKAGNLSRTALQGGDKGTEAGKKSGKIVKALNKDAEKYDRNDVKEDASMTPQELQLQKKKAMIDRMIAQRRQQGLNKAKKSEAPAKAMGEDVEVEGYEPMTPERKLRVDRAKRGAYDKDQRAQYQGDKKEADKQFKRRMAMDSKTKMRKEETEDSLRDRRMERGGVDGNTRYDKAPKPANTAGKKKPYDGMSALEKVKASIRAKHGQGAIMDTKKK
jgi:hypothetical protein